MNHFGFLNAQKKIRTFICFKKGDHKEQARVIGSSTSSLNMVRNPQTKDYVFLIQTTMGGSGGQTSNLSTAICFYDKETKRTITFSNNHIFADQDVHHQRSNQYTEVLAKKGHTEKELIDTLMLQSISITEFD